MTDVNATNDAVAKKIEAIKAEITRKNQEAQNLLGYLVEQQNLAKQEEELEEEDLKKQGIIVGQHIPSLPSRLNLDGSQLSQYETFSSTLLVAKDLIDQNRTDFLRRTGNLPISEAAEERRESNKSYLAQQDPDKPHYLLQTNNTKVREERINVRFAETIEEVHKTKKTTNVKEDTTATISTKKAKPDKHILTMKEKLEHEAVIKGLQHKMNYMRNPRNNPNSVTKMLNKPKNFHSKSVDGGINSEGNKEAGEGDSFQDGGSVDGNNNNDDDQGSLSSRLKAKYSKFIKLDNNPLFVCEPKIVSFMDYEIGQKYTKNISFKNISAVSRTVRILPPKSKLFTISPLKYPPNCSNGVIAPGMAVSCTLAFIPESLGDFEEYITVNTESGTTSVKIIAQREPPNLDLPKDINLGYSLVGDAQRSVILVTNTGGFGNFKLLENNDREECDDYELNAQNIHCLRISPFTVYPAEFALGKGQSVELNFEFIPLKLGKLARKYQILCDNGDLKSYSLLATSKQIQLSTLEINNVEFNDQDKSVYRDLYFNNVVAGWEMNQQISIVNDTGISIEYEWVWVDKSLPYIDWNTIGQDLIVKRDKSQRLLTGVLDTRGNTAALPTNPESNNNHEVEVDHNLLRSLKETLHHGESSTKGNSNKEGPFEILPARGVIAGEGAAEFKFIYNPLSKDSTTLRAIMMIKSVSNAAMPNQDQEKALNELLTKGHGSYPRLSSWLEEIGLLGDVNEYRKLNGYPSHEKKLIPLRALIQLVYSQVVDSSNNNRSEEANDPDSDANKEKSYRIHQVELPRMNRWLRNIIQHVYGLRKKEAVGHHNEEGSSVVNFPTGTTGHQYNEQGEKLYEIVELFEWTKNSLNSSSEEEAEISPSIPLVVPSLLLKYFEDNIGLNEEDLEDPDDESVVEKVDNGFDRELQELLTSPDAHMLTEIFVDRVTSLTLFGDYISSLLDVQVSHEAVDFLKEVSLTNLSSISFLVHGKSQATKLVLSPPKLILNSFFTLGYEFETSVTLFNPNDSSLQLSVDLANTVMKRILFVNSQSGGGAHAMEETHQELDKQLLSLASLIQKNPSAHHPNITDSTAENENLEIIASNDSILLLPHSSEKLTFKIKVHKLGVFEIFVPVKSLNDVSCQVEMLSIQANIIGPKIRYDTAEVDLGLLGVGDENKFSLTFSNESNVPLMFMMKPTIHVDNTAASKKGSILADANNSHNMLSARDSARSNSENNQQIPYSARSARSARSNHSQMSRASSMRSDDFSMNDSQASTDFKIELKNASIQVEPSNGVIEPHSSLSVNVICKSGKTPQRVRGMIESRIFDILGKNEISKQYLNLRGEIQSPKVLIYPQHHNFGQVYVGRPIKFQFILENICNLPTKFKFLRPGGPSSFFNFSLEPSKGSLNAKEKLTIQGTFTSLTTGLIDDLLSCKLFGITTPLGINFKALSKGISLEFINLKENEPMPQPIAREDDSQFPSALNNEKPPEPRPVEPIFLGQDVPLYERRKCRFVIRNLSAIPVPYEIKPKKFMVIEKKKRFGKDTANSQIGTASSLGLGLGVGLDGVNPPPPAVGGGGGSVAGNSVAGGAGGDLRRPSLKSVTSGVSIQSASEAHSVTTAGAPPPRQGLLLAPHEDGTNKFSSESGKKYIAFELNRREDRKYLKSGFGASFFIDVTSGLLPPWGVQEIHVYAFNDIPGSYDDEIEISIRENEIVRKFLLPIKMTVIGCPIVIEKHTMGMTEAKDPLFLDVIVSNAKNSQEKEKKDSNSFSVTPQLLQLGEICEHGNLLKRHFIVKNYGSKNAKVKWQIRGLTAKANGPIKISLNYVNRDSYSDLSPKKLKLKNINPEHRVKTSIRFWDDIAKESPFQIEPLKSTIPPYEKQIFTVTLNHSSPQRNEKAMLTANVIVDEEDNTLKLQHQQNPQESSRILNDGLPELTKTITEMNLPSGLLENETTEKQQLPPENSHVISHTSIRTATTATTTTNAANKQQFQLQLFVEGSYIHPRLEIDKYTHQIPYENTVASDLQSIRLTAKSTLLFSSMNSSQTIGGGGGDLSMQTNPICSKLISITNPLDIEAVIHVATEGALLIKDYMEESSSANEKKIGGKPVFTKKAVEGGGGGDHSPSSHREPQKDAKNVKFEDQLSKNNKEESSIVSVKSQKNPNKEGKVLKLIPHVRNSFFSRFYRFCDFSNFSFSFLAINQIHDRLQSEKASARTIDVHFRQRIRQTHGTEEFPPVHLPHGTIPTSARDHFHLHSFHHRFLSKIVFRDLFDPKNLSGSFPLVQSHRCTGSMEYHSCAWRRTMETEHRDPGERI
jgi:hypothetical protein